MPVKKKKQAKKTSSKAVKSAKKKVVRSSVKASKPAVSVPKAAKVVPLFPAGKKRMNASMPTPASKTRQTVLSKQELKEFKEMLLNMRQKIVGDLQHLESDSLKKSTEEMTGDHADIIDTAQDEFDREFVLNLAANEQQILNKIDIALRRITEGTYGICEKYGTPIPKKRLLAMPYATMSIQAQEEEERAL